MNDDVANTSVCDVAEFYMVLDISYVCPRTIKNPILGTCVLT